MTENSFFQRLKKLKVDLKDMTFRQKVDHIWTYFKEVILITVISLIVIIGVGINVFTPKKELLMGGMCACTYLTEEGEHYLQEAYFDKLQGNPKKQEVGLHFRSFGDFATSPQDYEAFQAIIAMMSAEMIDYLLIDDDRLEPFIGYESLMDLREVFTEQELEQFGKKLRYAQHVDEDGNPTGEQIPVALDITDLPFTQNCRLYEQNIYLCFAANAPNKDSLRDLWQYLLDWEVNTKA
ncbi:MAG: hypothetical protein IJB91_04110 [Oscillospiraceae bacterium]|nr:hypothetical protein [Oscillospiraceae bacterium]